MIPAKKILYCGRNFGTSLHRAKALQRLGHKVRVMDPWDFLPRGKTVRRILEKLICEVGAFWLEPYVHLKMKSVLKGLQFDVIWSDQSELIGFRTTEWLKTNARFMITYAVDDPFGSRDKKRFWTYRKALSFFDLIAVVRESNIAEAYKCGAKNVLYVPRSADEVEHAPVNLSRDDFRKWQSEVAFVGTWMPERGPFIACLLNLGIPLIIYGDRWHKAREWPILSRVWRGPSLIGTEYVKAIQSAKICLGLLSKGNRDLHTQRSAEIPYIGSVLCAERTTDHQSMYRENEEAVFWNTAEECARNCFALLADDPRRQAMAFSGRQRCIQSGYLNEPLMNQILEVCIK